MNSKNQLPRLDQFETYRPTKAMSVTARQRDDVYAETLTQRQLVISWVCALIAAGIMIETLFYKFTGSAESHYIFQKMHSDPFMRWTQGTWELLASICLLMPRLRWMGSILTTGAMAAAILSHLTWLGFSVLGDHGLLFGMAITTFTCGFTILIMHRHQIPFVTPLSSW